MLGRLLPEISSATGGTASPPDGEPVGRAAGDACHLFEAIGQLLTRLARRQPLVIVREDLHWADEMSLRFLAFLGRRLPAVPLLVLATVSEEELADSGLLRQTLNELDEGEWLLRLPLGPLSQADTAALVRVLAAPGIPDPLLTDLANEAWRASDGNAFVVVEVMHALREGAMVPGARRKPIRLDGGRAAGRSRGASGTSTACPPASGSDYAVGEGGRGHRRRGLPAAPGANCVWSSGEHPGVVTRELVK